MTAALEPDQAVQQWREQIEENNRLQHTIADQSDRINELAILNNEALFAAGQYKAQFDAIKSERDQLQLLSTIYRAKLEAFAGVAADVARTITSLGDQATDAANVRAALAQMAAPAQDAPAGPASPAIAPASIDDAAAAMGAAIAPPVVAPAEPPAVADVADVAGVYAPPPTVPPIKTSDAPRPVKGPPDDVTTLPTFLTADAPHVTPLPAVTP